MTGPVCPWRGCDGPPRSGSESAGCSCSATESIRPPGLRRGVFARWSLAADAGARDAAALAAEIASDRAALGAELDSQMATGSAIVFTTLSEELLAPFQKEHREIEARPDLVLG